MTYPTTGDRGPLEDLWRPPVRPGDTQQIPVSPSGEYGGYEDTGDYDPNQPPVGAWNRDRPRRRGFGSLLLELLVVAAVSAGAAAAMGWTVLKDLPRVIPGSGTGPYLELWSLAWSGHALKPSSGIALTQVFDGNAFSPADYSLAFSDSLLGYGPLTWFFHGAAGLVTAYNLIFVFAPALSAFGAYALARQLGAHPVGAAVAGAGFAYAPAHFGQFSHLGVLSTGGLVLAFAMLARGHGLTMSGGRPPIRPLWVLLGWLVAAWQLTIGFALGLPFAYLLGVIGVVVLLIAPVRLVLIRRRDRYLLSDPNGMVVAGEPVRPRRTVRVLLADIVGAGVFSVVGVLMAYPYLRVHSIETAAVDSGRTLDTVLRLSPKPVGLITPPSVEGTWSWLTQGDTLVSGTNEGRLLPGAILLALAVLGLVLSAWRWWWRVTLLVAAVLIAGLALGERLPDQAFPGADSPFALLWRHAPGWAADRTPGRLMVFATLALALLAAGAVTRLCGWGALGQRFGARGLRSMVFFVLPVVVVLEGFAQIPVSPVPAPPKAFSQAVGPVVVLPSQTSADSTVMFWSATRGFPDVANGHSGITPITLTAMRTELAGFPDQRAVSYLRRNGFRSVVVVPARAGAALAKSTAADPDPVLGLTRTDLGDSLLYTLTPAT
jgi:hypothetical protein